MSGTESEAPMILLFIITAAVSKPIKATEETQPCGRGGIGCCVI